MQYLVGNLLEAVLPSLSLNMTVEVLRVFSVSDSWTFLFDCSSRPSWDFSYVTVNSFASHMFPQCIPWSPNGVVLIHHLTWTTSLNSQDISCTLNRYIAEGKSWLHVWRVLLWTTGSENFQLWIILKSVYKLMSPLESRRSSKRSRHNAPSMWRCSVCSHQSVLGARFSGFRDFLCLAPASCTHRGIPPPIAPQVSVIELEEVLIRQHDNTPDLHYHLRASQVTGSLDAVLGKCYWNWFRCAYEKCNEVLSLSHAYSGAPINNSVQMVEYAQCNKRTCCQDPLWNRMHNEAPSSVLFAILEAKRARRWNVSFARCISGGDRVRCWMEN